MIIQTINPREHLNALGLVNRENGGGFNHTHSQSIHNNQFNQFMEQERLEREAFLQTEEAMQIAQTLREGALSVLNVGMNVDELEFITEEGQFVSDVYTARLMMAIPQVLEAYQDDSITGFNGVFDMPYYSDLHADPCYASGMIGIVNNEKEYVVDSFVLGTTDEFRLDEAQKIEYATMIDFVGRQIDNGEDPTLIFMDNNEIEDDVIIA